MFNDVETHNTQLTTQPKENKNKQGYTMKNQKGFTLIELMVVIVIIGILSAVALPKMFSMSNKAKASEIKPAAATYERLQLTYIAEESELGAEADIGWEDPQSKFFTYDGDGTKGSMAIDNDKPLGECAKGAGDWKTEVSTLSVIKRTPSTGKCLAISKDFIGGYS